MKGTLAKVVLAGGVVLSATVLFLPKRASAVPAFARRYHTACTTCHVLPPKLNAFGVAFKNNGYHMPKDDEKFIKQPDVELGAPGWEKVWPKGVWPGAIADRVPLSVGVEMVTDVTPSEPVHTNFAFPEEFELISAGTLGPRFSFFGDLAFEFETPETEVDLERAHFNIRLTESPLVNLRLGRFETGATPFSRFTYRLTDQEFIIHDFNAVPEGPFSFRQRQQGFELWGAKNGPGGGGFQYSLGLVNGNGPSSDTNTKSWYGSASYKIGGMGVTGPVGALDVLQSRENYIDNSLEIGAFGYVGRTGATPEEEVRFNRVGFKVNAYFNRLNLFGAYVRGRDLVLARGTPEVNTHSWFAEADVVTPWPWIVGIVRYDQAIGEGDFLHVKRVVPGVAMMIRANVILTAEGTIYNGTNNNLLNGETDHNGAVFRLLFFF